MPENIFINQYLMAEEAIVLLGGKFPTQMVTSANGSYTATVNSDNVEIIGTGNELVSGTDLVEVNF